MNRVQLACYCLIASAFVLAGLLVTNLRAPLTSEADAAMVIARENFTLMTAQTRDDEEALFVLDNSTARLIVYRMDLGRRTIEVAGGVSLEELFARGAAGGGGGGNRR